ncbi:MAG: hypothetical protein C4520_10285 [Candidatus Abyssobacteria bacterium SURF_5]|uniref:B box-type domain-containing protein n=1 Tax=Abyssobacteria bacterium (strain SURF_5) TaxID=2093360 RepID=A0A3A4NWA3_ABYX5|nr:MAG: hypothetical protein C4520_10285 [Candidatus Abyssubacteria bacterium SURF_5]
MTDGKPALQLISHSAIKLHHHLHRKAIIRRTGEKGACGMSEKADAPPPRKFRRKIPCKNHPSAPAVDYCQTCGLPICKECAISFSGASFCSSECWSSKSAEESKDAVANRKKRERRADFAVTAGMWAFCMVVLAAIGIFIFQKTSDHSGEKLWEIDSTEGFYEYFAQSQLASFFALRTSGYVEALDLRTGSSKWKVGSSPI